MLKANMDMEPSGEEQKLLFIIIYWHITKVVYPVWGLVHLLRNANTWI